MADGVLKKGVDSGALTFKAISLWRFRSGRHLYQKRRRFLAGSASEAGASRFHSSDLRSLVFPAAASESYRLWLNCR